MRLSPTLLRGETDADVAFLQALYATTRERELVQLTHWSDEQIRQFVEMQFHAQLTHYRRHYPDASYEIIECAGEPIGRLYLAKLTDEVRLMDISLIPQARNAGIGERLCRDLMQRAREAGCIVSLHVEEDNPAKRLYDRLGFVTVGEVTFYKLMHWVPEGLEAVSARIAAQLNTAS